MNIKHLLFISSLLLTLIQPAQANVAEPNNSNDKILQQIEESLSWRSNALQFAEQTKNSLKQGHLNPNELQTFIQGAQYYMALREQLLQHVNRGSWLVADDARIKWAEDQPSSIETQNAQRIVTLNPNDPQGQQWLQQLEVSLAAALTLYDNYLIGIYPFLNHPKTRYLLNHDNPTLEGKLNEVTNNYLAITPRKQVARAVAWYSRYQAWQKQQPQSTGTDKNYLAMLIEQSPTRHYLFSKGTYPLDKRMESHIAKVSDQLYFMKRAFTFVSSKVFGNAMGLIEFRKGLLANLPEAEQQQLSASIQPLDIMLEKTPFRLTDQFIPGYYGHVAVWAGNEKQLRDLGVWDHPAVQPHQSAIRAGKRIVEALRSGVEINTLAHFLNIDDLLVLRRSNLTTEQQREHIIRLFQQVGKEYDFNFDIETDRRIVCSELAYVVHFDINWQTSKTLGRYTISPDHVAKQAINGGPLVPVVIYREGKKVNNQLAETLAQLIK